MTKNQRAKKNEDLLRSGYHAMLDLLADRLKARTITMSELNTFKDLLEMAIRGQTGEINDTKFKLCCGCRKRVE